MDGTLSVSMFLLVGHERQTFAIDLEPHRLADQFAYKLDQTFDLVSRLQPLGELEVTLPPQAQVTGTFSYEIDSWPCERGGIIVKPIRFALITDPLPKRRQPDVEEDDAIGDTDDDVEGDIGACSEDDDDQCVVGALTWAYNHNELVVVLTHVKTFLVVHLWATFYKRSQRSIKTTRATLFISTERFLQTQVDTDTDSAASNSSSDNSDDGEHDDDKWIKPPMLPVIAEDAKAEATQTRCCTVRELRGIKWQSEYFYIPEPAKDASGLRIFIRNAAKESEGMSKVNQTKHLTPSHYGETMESCTVTMLLLRAWSIWRAHQDGWANARPCRKRQIDEDLSRLQRDVLKIRAENEGSLGHRKADAVWQCFERECPALAW